VTLPPSTCWRACPVPFRFHDADYDIRVHRPVINLTHAGEVHEIKWNAHLAEIFDMPAEVMEDYYRAYRAFMALTRDAAFHLTLKLGRARWSCSTIAGYCTVGTRSTRRPDGGISRAVTWTGARCCRGSGSCRADSRPRGRKTRVFPVSFSLEKLPPYPGARSAHPAKIRSRNTTT
jgi:hypothetical protein